MGALALLRQFRNYLCHPLFVLIHQIAHVLAQRFKQLVDPGFAVVAGGGDGFGVGILHLITKFVETAFYLLAVGVLHLVHQLINLRFNLREGVNLPFRLGDGLLQSFKRLLGGRNRLGQAIL